MNLTMSASQCVDTTPLVTSVAIMGVAIAVLLLGLLGLRHIRDQLKLELAEKDEMVGSLQTELHTHHFQLQSYLSRNCLLLGQVQRLGEELEEAKQHQHNGGELEEAQQHQDNRPDPGLAM